MRLVLGLGNIPAPELVYIGMKETQRTRGYYAGEVCALCLSDALAVGWLITVSSATN